MKQFIFLLVASFFNLNLFAQALVFPDDLLANSPKNKARDTAIISNPSESNIDGIRTEMSAKETGAKKADKTYRNLGFKASVGEYLKDIDTQELNEEKILHLANSFRLNSQTEEAEYWYSRVIGEHSKTKNLLRYAQVLQSNGKCEDATRWYKRFEETASRKERKNRELIIDCEDLKTIQDHQDVSLKNVRALNTEHLDFSPIAYKDGVVFSSTRKNNKSKKMIDSWTNDNFSDLFYAAYDHKLKRFKRAVPLKGDLNKQFHDGVATFDQSGSVMFFTRNNDNGKGASKDGLVDLKIYVAYLNDGEWTQVQELPFNSDEFTSCHPTLSVDGQHLYFASNRPGGYGGLDIYVSQNDGGLWGEPKNLGPIVNSAGNEIFPVIDNQDVLYFSSNGHRGIGGLDIFSAQKAVLDDESSWNIRENIGTPFNSPKDDFGFVLLGDDLQIGLLCSNRTGGKGKDDIYSWNRKANKQEEGILQRKICVYDEKTGTRLEHAQVRILEKTNPGKHKEDLTLSLEPVEGKKDKYILGITGKNEDQADVQYFETEENGVFSFSFAPNKTYQLSIERKGYTKEELVLNYSEIKQNEDYCIALVKPNCRAITGLVVNKVYDVALPLAEIEVWNKCTNERNKFATDESGNFELCIPCGCEYQVFASKPGFQTESELISSLSLDCNKDELIKTKLALSLENEDIATEREITQPISNANTQPAGTVPVTTYKEVITYIPVKKRIPVISYVPITDFVGQDEIELSEGQIISLKDIYYDFNQSYIREDASIDLEHVYNLMMKYPNLEIELMSHTDSRGGTRYNKMLSRKRARAARKFLIRKGIKAHRIVATGYGESQLKNYCSDGVECSPEEHQDNRRTEIKVRKF